MSCRSRIRKSLIGTDRTILKVIHSELRANVHADKASEFLREP